MFKKIDYIFFRFKILLYLCVSHFLSFRDIVCSISNYDAVEVKNLKGSLSLITNNNKLCFMYSK